ncbi:DUF7269 family protein [Halorussus sp. AFM4]|uniref:DUF7269 family protein n=1 Tax=Halorussus sp. AFM4 TaxID=3421651 RepID=UPI003EBEA7F7
MRTRVLGGLGALLTLAAAAVVVSPTLADHASTAVGALASRDPRRVLLVLGSVVGAYAAWTARASRPEGPPPDAAAARFSDPGLRPESVTAVDRARTGESFDDRVARACEGDERAFRAVRARLADTAADAVARAADASPERARQAVGSGAWTDDPIAAAFLADESGPTFSLLARLRAWLDPAAERRRRIDRTVDAVSRVLDEEDDRLAPADSSAGAADGGDA